MTPIQFTEDQYDMLKEVVNQAMGQAGSDLAQLLIQGRERRQQHRELLSRLDEIQRSPSG